MTGMTPRPPRTVKASDLTTAEAAALAGVKPRTWSAYVARGQAPAPAARIGTTVGTGTSSKRGSITAPAKAPVLDATGNPPKDDEHPPGHCRCRVAQLRGPGTVRAVRCVNAPRHEESLTRKLHAAETGGVSQLLAWGFARDLLDALYGAEQAEVAADRDGYFPHRDRSLNGRTLGGLMWFRGAVVHEDVDPTAQLLVPMQAWSGSGEKLGFFFQDAAGEMRRLQVHLCEVVWPDRSSEPPTAKEGMSSTARRCAAGRGSSHSEQLSSTCSTNGHENRGVLCRVRPGRESHGKPPLTATFDPGEACVNGRLEVPGFGQVEVPTLCGVDQGVGSSPPRR